jgi:hypothetical protein
MGIATIRIVDPETRTGRICTRKNRTQARRLEVPGTPVYVRSRQPVCTALLESDCAASGIATIEPMDKLALLTEILTQNPTDNFARYGLAMELISQSRTDDGLAEFAKLIEQSPDYVPAYQMSAQTLARLNRIDEALARLHAGIAAANRTGNQHALAEMDALRDELS